MPAVQLSKSACRSLAVGLLVSACSSSSVTSPGSVAWMPAGQDAAPQRDGSSARGDAPSGAADGSSSRDASIDSPAPASFATPYFPLQVGLSWQFSGCSDAGPGTSTITAQSDASGMTVFTETDPPGCYFASLQYGLLPATATGQNVEVNAGTGWYLQYVFPPQLNVPWGAGGNSGAIFEWDMHYDSYTVTAGTFSDCFRRNNTYGWEIYCRDVGMVQGSSDGVSWELVGKGF